MKIHYTLLALFLGISIQSQTFEVVPILDNGNPDKHLNLVIMGDGYTDVQQDDFINTAQNISNYLFSISPWSTYKNYFNVFAIKVIATQTGVKHANTASDCADYFTEVSNPTNYFGTKFDGYGIHRLTIVTSNVKVANVLSANFPNYDLVFIVGNSNEYGGSGGSYAVFTADEASSEIAAHEIGHTFGRLADEYYAGDQYFQEKVNMTQQTDPNLVKWKNWLTEETNIGIDPYCCGGNSALWYKPVTNQCKMEQLNLPYCDVCKEGIVERIHALISPIESYAPNNATVINVNSDPVDFALTSLIRPIPNTLQIQWQLDGNFLSSNENYTLNPTTLSDGDHILTATVTDQTTLVRTDNHPTIHFNTVAWNLNKSNLGIHAQPHENTIALKMYPNPVTNVVNFELDLLTSAKVSIDLTDVTGKIVRQISERTASAGVSEILIDMNGLTAGVYVAELKIDGAAYPQKIVKQ
ncbi:T9SS type A sorting domain-containing protein [Flavobacterium sp. CYK-55]|uniref:T9SS type A sorting domain-containing protein n=1 Tax=Flavobacterium sp. CYK-55 TaxID=2835529 RepID=UPI001BCBD6C6|nr:M64 family metallopeptidase [Flavobacterium sp. CYK-55]MBS7787438.1 T9SS type A sorting domain-containing protein [Flavobacterium sp. CYK-55]